MVHYKISYFSLWPIHVAFLIKNIVKNIYISLYEKNIPADHFHGIRHKIWLHGDEENGSMRDVQPTVTKYIWRQWLLHYNTEYNTQHKDILDMDQFVLTIYIEYRYKSLINIMIHHN